MGKVVLSSDEFVLEINEELKNKLAIFGMVNKCPIPDVLNLLTLQKKTGKLVVKYSDVEKTIFFRKGEIVFASSTLKEDRLGESLVRSGKITKQQLDEASLEVKKGKKLGRVLVERGWITPKEMFEGVRKQVQEIIFSLFSLSEGIFYFIEGEVEHDNIIRFNMSTQMLIMEGIRITDEVSVYRKLYPDGAYLKPVKGTSNLSKDEMEIMNLIGMGQTVGMLKTMSGLSEYELLKTIHTLKEKGAIRIEEKSEERFNVAEIIQNINSILMDIFSIIKIREPKFDYLSFFNDFFENMDEEEKEIFNGIKLNESGGIDTDKLLENLEKCNIQNKEKLAVEALRELIRFELFELKLYLNKKESEELQKILETTGLL